MSSFFLVPTSLGAGSEVASWGRVFGVRGWRERMCKRFLGESLGSRSSMLFERMCQIGVAVGTRCISVRFVMVRSIWKLIICISSATYGVRVRSSRLIEEKTNDPGVSACTPRRRGQNWTTLERIRGPSSMHPHPSFGEQDACTVLVLTHLIVSERRNLETGLRIVGKKHARYERSRAY